MALWMSLVWGNGCPETVKERILSLYLLGSISQRYVKLIDKTVRAHKVFWYIYTSLFDRGSQDLWSLGFGLGVSNTLGRKMVA